MSELSSKTGLTIWMRMFIYLWHREAICLKFVDRFSHLWPINDLNQKPVSALLSKEIYFYVVEVFCFCYGYHDFTCFNHKFCLTMKLLRYYATLNFWKTQNLFELCEKKWEICDERAFCCLTSPFFLHCYNPQYSSFKIVFDL